MPHITVTTEAPTTPAGPTITHYQQLAKDFIAAIDQIATIIPQLTAIENAVAKFTRGHLGVSEQFLATAIAAVEQLPDLQGLHCLDPVAGRDALQFLEAFRTVRDRAIAFAKDLKFAFDSRKANLVTEALQIYDVAKGLARNKRDPNMTAHVDNMKRDLGRRGPTKAQRDERNAQRLKQAVADALQKEVKKAA